MPLAESSAAEIDRTVTLLPVVDVIHSSPSGRCRMLAEAIGKRDRLPVRTDSRLLELDFGAWEGRRWDEVPRAELDAWATDIWQMPPGGGESVRSLWARVEDFRKKELGAGASNCESAVLIVSHHGPLRVLWAQANDWAPERIFRDHFPHGIAGLRSIRPPPGAFEYGDSLDYKSTLK